MATSSSGGAAGRVALVERARSAVARAIAGAEQARQRVPLVDLGFDIRERDRRSAASLLAGALAYRLFVFLLPVALLLVGGLGLLSSLSDGAPEDVAADRGFSAYVVAEVGDASEQARGGWLVTLLVALAALVIAGTAATRALRRVHELAWDVPPSRARAPWRGAFALLAGCSLAALVVEGAREVRDWSPGPGVLATTAALSGFVGLRLGAALLLPHADAPWWALLPGSIVFALGVQALHVFSVYYLTGKLQSASDLYGSLGAAAAVLLWLYLVARLLVTAAIVDATLWHRRVAVIRQRARCHAPCAPSPPRTPRP